MADSTRRRTGELLRKRFELLSLVEPPVLTKMPTSSLPEEARTPADRRVTLVDLERLFELWVEHYNKLDDEGRRRMPLKPNYFLAPQE
jgi:hypothetical protein